MKRAIALSMMLASVSAFTACSSSSGSGGQKKADIIQPEVDIRELVGPSDMGYMSGPVDIQYEVRVANRSGEPISLKRIEVQSSNTGGAYRLRHDVYPFKETIAPSGFTTVKFWAHAYAYSGRARQTEPVTFRGIIYFDSPAGAFQKIFIKELMQWQGSNQ